MHIMHAYDGARQLTNVGSLRFAPRINMVMDSNGHKWAQMGVV